MLLPDVCTIETAMRVVGGKWKLAIVKTLLDGTVRFNELQRQLPSVTARMLARQLRELERDDIVRRVAYPEVPPRVEYSLTETGRTLREVAIRVESWGRTYCAEHEVASPAEL